MRWWLAMLLLGSGLWAQDGKPQKQAPPKDQRQEEAPPEEDESLKPKEYAFNPLEAERDIRIGNYYYKRGKYPAALSRFQEATKWNPGLAEAYLRICETAEKMKDKATAKEAYRKYIEMAPDAKDAAQIKKKIGKS